MSLAFMICNFYDLHYINCYSRPNKDDKSKTVNAVRTFNQTFKYFSVGKIWSRINNSGGGEYHHSHRWEALHLRGPNWPNSISTGIEQKRKRNMNIEQMQMDMNNSFAVILNNFYSNLVQLNPCAVCTMNWIGSIVSLWVNTGTRCTSRHLCNFHITSKLPAA